MKNEAQIMTIPYLLSILIAKRWWWMLEATITPICPKNFIYSTRFVATIVKAVIPISLYFLILFTYNII